MGERVARNEGYPSLTAREHWGKYAAGVAIEAAFIAVLTAIGFMLAVVGMMIWG